MSNETQKPDKDEDDRPPVVKVRKGKQGKPTSIHRDKTKYSRLDQSGWNQLYPPVNGGGEMPE